MLGQARRLSRRIIKSQLLILLIGAGLFCLLYLFRLGSLVPGLSDNEQAAAGGSRTLSAIIHDPLYGPHKIIQLGVKSVFGSTPTSLRLASVIFVGLFLISFYLLAARWFGRLISLAGFALLAATPWVALLGRNAAPSIMLLTPIAAILCYYWFSRGQGRLKFRWLFFCICMALTLYIPGLVWILLAGAIINRRSLLTVLSRLNLLWQTTGLLLFAGLLAPLAWAFVSAPSLVRSWLLIPAALPGAGTLAKEAGWATSSLILRTPGHIEWLVGRLPILTVMTTALIVFGIYAMSQQARQKLYVIACMVGFGWLAATLNDSLVYLTLCLGPLLILAAAGLRFLFLQWQSVFPLNPLPRYLAYGLIVAVAVVQGIYGLRTVLYAWPNTPETQATFVLK